MEPSGTDVPDVVASGQRLLELLESLTTELAEEFPDVFSDEPASPSSEIGGEPSPAMQEERAITRTRGSLARSRSNELMSRLEQARRHARQVIDAATMQRAGEDPTEADGSAGSASSEVAAGDDAASMRTTLANAARHLNRTRTASSTPEEMLHSIVAAAMAAIPNVTGASVTLIDRAGVISTHAPSSELVAEVDRVQVELEEGPCVDALAEAGDGVTHAPDLQAAPPWPQFADRALQAGFYEVLSFQLVAGGAAGALNLYAAAPHHLDAQDELVGALFADQAAIALAGARRVGQLNAALESRDLIGRAKGILMERFGLTDADAFAMLVSSSQDTNMKLVAVAQWLVGEVESSHRRQAPDR